MSRGIDHDLLREIATDAHIPVAQVEFTYTKICMRLRAHSKVHDFIPLLAMNQLRDYYLHRHVSTII